VRARCVAAGQRQTRYSYQRDDPEWRHHHIPVDGTNESAHCDLEQRRGGELPARRQTGSFGVHANVSVAVFVAGPSKQTTALIAGCAVNCGSTVSKAAALLPVISVRWYAADE
jgi:hypothetical protein